MYNKIRRALTLIALFSAVVGFWALALNQFGSALRQHKELLIHQAQAACLEYDFPHALVSDGITYCNAIYMGSDIVVPLTELQAYYAEK